MLKSRPIIWIIAVILSIVALYAAVFVGSPPSPEPRAASARPEPASAPAPQALPAPGQSATAEPASAGASGSGVATAEPTEPDSPVAPQPAEPPAPRADILPPTRYDEPEPTTPLPPVRETGLVFSNKPAPRDKP